MKTKRTRSSFRSMNSERRLESIFLFVTGKCNAKCAMCFYANDMAKKEKDLTFEEIRKISETAGESINCPDCNINVSISLDGFGDTHDTQRGVPGNFYKAADTIRKVSEHFKDDGKVLLNVATVITKYNIDQINDFMTWMYGRFHLSTHTIEAARGVTREDGVKALDESTLRRIQDEAAPIYRAYAKRMVSSTSGLRKPITKFFYIGIIRALYDIRASNIDQPTPWGMDCTAGETTLVIDYDGRFRSCELREPLGNVKDYDCDVQQIMQSEAMKQEIEAIGHGYKANCWCTHGCFITSSLTFNPRKMIKKVYKGYREVNKLDKPIDFGEDNMSKMEEHYHLDREKLRLLGIIRN